MYQGDCNGCGKCCTGLVFRSETGAFVTAYCENLVVADRVGRPQATLCAVHGKRKIGMKVNFFLADGTGGYEGRCLSTYPREQDAIPPECSYTWRSDKPKPRWHVGYAPRLGNLVSEIW